MKELAIKFWMGTEVTRYSYFLRWVVLICEQHSHRVAPFFNFIHLPEAGLLLKCLEGIRREAIKELLVGFKMNTNRLYL